MRSALSAAAHMPLIRESDDGKFAVIVDGEVSAIPTRSRLWAADLIQFECERRRLAEYENG